MRFLMIIACLLTPGLAQAHDLPFSSVSCGDHWLTVEADIDPTGLTAVVTLSGDSQPHAATTPATISMSGSDVEIVLADDAQTTLVIDASDHWHGLFWGKLLVDGQEQQLGLCDVE